jgi:spermidine synthase
LNHGSYNVGVVGLGTGTLTAFGRQGDLFRFYEINPDVLRLSDEWFWYRKNTLAQVEIVLGDGRIQLEHELAQGRNQRFDILVADAFSSDAIPLHLLTRECALLYRQHLKDDGILAIYISNQHLDLVPVALGMAQALKWEAVLIDSEDNLDEDAWAATWMLITANQTVLNLPIIRKVRTDWPIDAITPLLWTDEYTSLLHVLN